MRTLLAVALFAMLPAAAKGFDDEATVQQEQTVISSSVPFPIPCSTEAPSTPFDSPECADYELNTTLIESMRGGDRSALDLLRQRFEHTLAYTERHRIAAALLGRLADDSEYWKELSERATIAVRFPFDENDDPSPQFAQWCGERGVDPENYQVMAIDALRTVAVDRRARPILARALESKDHIVVVNAINGIIIAEDTAYLPGIEKALERLGDDASQYAMYLAALRSDAADRIAMRFLDEKEQRDYWEQRHRLQEDPAWP